MRVLIGTADGLCSLDDAQRDHAGHDVTALVHDGGAVWALLDGKTLHRTEAGGEWREVAMLEDVMGNCLLPQPDGLLVGTSLARLVRLVGDDLRPVEEFNDAPGRERWSTPWGGPPDVRSMTATQRGDILVNVHVGGIVRWANGEGWQPTIDINADVHQVVVYGDRILAACARGLALSDDGGATWHITSNGLHNRYSRAVAVAGETVLLSASQGPYGPRGALYRAPLADPDRLERCTNGLPDWFDENIDTYCVAASGSEVIFGTEDGDVYRSTDEGLNWQHAAGGLAAVRCVLFA